MVADRQRLRRRPSGASCDRGQRAAVHLAVAFLGLMMLCLWRGRCAGSARPWRWPSPCGPAPAAPDAWIAADGSTAAVRQGQSGRAAASDAKRFGAELWARRRGLTPATWSLYACDKRTCAPGSGRARAPVSLSWTAQDSRRRTPVGLCVRRGGGFRGRRRTSAAECAPTLLLTPRTSRAAARPSSIAARRLADRLGSALAGPAALEPLR
jgi:hypothetical protein